MKGDAGVLAGDARHIFIALRCVVVLTAALPRRCSRAQRATKPYGKNCWHQ
jgi:hypothetical protein